MSKEIVVPEDSQNILGLQPADFARKAYGLAPVIRHVIDENGWAVRIGESDHLRIEAWTFIGGMFGVYPTTEWSRETGGSLGPGWEACVSVHTSNGVRVGQSEAMCLRSEKNWAKKDYFQLRSMAQTRAASKALSSSLRFIAVMAKYSGTPYEEMTKEEQ